MFSKNESKDKKIRAAFDAAIAKGDLRAVTALLNDNKELKPSIIDKNSLATAIHNRQLKILELLLMRGANPNQEDAQGHTPLQWAVLYEETDIIKLLIKYKADATIRNISVKTKLGRANHTLLYWAVLQGEVDIIYALKGTDVNSNEHRNVFDLTPLGLIVAWGDIRMTKALLEIGVDPNVKREKFLSRTTPLYDAADCGHLEVVETLLEHGADPLMLSETWTGKLRTPFDVGRKSEKIANVLSIFNTGDKAKHHVAYLLKKGHALEDFPYFLREPYPELLKAFVILVVEQEDLNILNSILKKYKKEKLDFLNDSTIMNKIIFCLEHKDLPVELKISVIKRLKTVAPDQAEKLQKIKEEILKIKNNQDTVYAAIFDAIDKNNYANVELILNANPSLNLNGPLNNSNGVTLLDFAYSRMLSYEEVKNNVDSEGKTLFEKNLDENKKIFLLLLKKSDINARTINDQSLLHIAITAKAPLHHLVLFLLQGAKPNCRDGAEKRPLDYLLLNKKGHLNDDEMKEHRLILEKGIDHLFQPEQKELLDNLLKQMKEDTLFFDYFHALLIQYFNKPDQNGNTWFHRVLINKEINLLDSPWINHIDPNIKNNEGHTVLDLAIRNEDFALVNLLLEKGAIVKENTFDNTSCLKHFNYLLNRQGHTLELLPTVVKKPYPLLLKVMVDKAVQEGRIDILNAIAKNYTHEQLSLLREPIFIQKIYLCLDKIKVLAPKHYKTDWPIIKKLQELNPADEQVLKLTHIVSSKISESHSSFLLFFSKIKNVFSSSKTSSSTKQKPNKNS